MLKVRFYPSKNNKENAPLLILIGFVGSNKRVLLKYKEIWKDFNVFMYTPPMDMTLIILRMASNILTKKIHKYYKNNESSSKIIYIHGISVGTCFIGGFLNCLENYKNGKYNYLPHYIKGIVLDSGLVINANDAIEGFSSGFKSKGGVISLTIPPIIKLFKPIFSDYCKRDVPYFYKYNYNYLIFYSDCDTYFPGASKKFIDSLISKDINNNDNNNIDNKKNSKRIIMEQKFDSHHIQHFRKYKNEYIESVQKFITYTQTE
ncbi:hypothetical protein ACTFIU_002600 [Dictyostelium citrinum]